MITWSDDTRLTRDVEHGKQRQLDSFVVINTPTIITGYCRGHNGDEAGMKW